MNTAAASDFAGPRRTSDDPIIDKFNALVRIASDPASRQTPEGETAGRTLAQLIKNHRLVVEKEGAAEQFPTEVAASIAAIPEIIRLRFENNDLTMKLTESTMQVLRLTTEYNQLRRQFDGIRTSDPDKKVKAMAREILEAADEWLDGQAEYALIPPSQAANRGHA